MFAEIHIAQILAAGWASIAPAYASFAKLYSTDTLGRPLVLDDGLKLEWYNDLCPDGRPDHLLVVDEDTEGRTPPPALLVQATDSRGTPTEPMGPSEAGVTDAIYQQVVTVTSLARSKELAQALTIFAGSAIKGRYLWLMKTMKYSGVSLAGVGALSPETRLLPERVVVYRSYISFNLHLHMRFPALDAADTDPLKFSVHHFDSVDAYGNPGRVIPKE